MKSLMHTKTAFIWSKKCYNLKEWFTISIYFKVYDGKGEFSASLLQSSVSHDPSEIILIWWFADQETFIIIINVEYLKQQFLTLPSLSL